MKRESGECTARAACGHALTVADRDLLAEVGRLGRRHTLADRAVECCTTPDWRKDTRTSGSRNNYLIPCEPDPIVVYGACVDTPTSPTRAARRKGRQTPDPRVRR